MLFHKFNKLNFINFAALDFTITIESGYYDTQRTVKKVSSKANCCYSGIGVFCSYQVFLVQFKDLTGITSVPK